MAYAQIYKWLVGATMAVPCSAAANKTTWTCLLTRPSWYQAMAVWDTFGSQPYTSEPHYRQYRDLMGHVFNVDGAVQIGGKLILLENSPADWGQGNSGIFSCAVK